METVANFIFLDSKITADCDCSHKITRCLLLERKAMKNLDIVLKSREISFQTKLHTAKAVICFLIVIYRCESWTVKNAEH